MNDQELSALIQQAKAQFPKPAPQQLASRTMEAYRARFARPSLLRRHWRLAAAAMVLVAALGFLGTRSSTGSPLPPEYGRGQVVADGRMRTPDGWKMDFSTVLQPAIEGQFLNVANPGAISQRTKGVIIFHRIFGDMSGNAWYGYDVVLHTDRSPQSVTLQPLSYRPEKTPAGLMGDSVLGSGLQIQAVPKLPDAAFTIRQNIAVPIFTVPSTGQTVIDYVKVDSTSLLDDLSAGFHGMVRTLCSHFMPSGPAKTDRDLRSR
jgi:hypothetical protein